MGNCTICGRDSTYTHVCAFPDTTTAIRTLRAELDALRAKVKRVAEWLPEVAACTRKAADDVWPMAKLLSNTNPPHTPRSEFSADNDAARLMRRLEAVAAGADELKEALK